MSALNTPWLRRTLSCSAPLKPPSRRQVPPGISAHATWSAAHATWASARATKFAAIATFCAVAFALLQPLVSYFWNTWRNRVAADGEMRRAFALIEESYSALPATGVVEEHELWTLLNRNNISRRLLEHWITSPLGDRRYPAFLMTTLQAMYEVRDAVQGSQPGGSWAVQAEGRQTARRIIGRAVLRASVARARLRLPGSQAQADLPSNGG